MKERTEQQRIDAGQRIKNFLSDEAVQEVFADLVAENENAFLNADTPDARTNCWAQAVVLAKFNARMIGLMDGGVAPR